MEDRVPLPFGTDSGQMSFEQYKNRDPLQVTSSDASQAAFDLSWDETAVGVMSRAAAIGSPILNTILKDTVWGKDIANLSGQGARDITPEEANTRYPDMPTKWNKPVNPYVAQLQYDRQIERQKLEATVAAGPQDLWSRAKYAGAGLLSHVMDPLEFGAGEVVGWGVGGLVSRSAWGAKNALMQKIAKEGIASVSSLGERTAYHALEAVPGNLIQNVALEGANAAVTTKLESGEYDPTMAMQNVAVGTFFGSVLHIGIKELSFQASNRISRFVNRNSPEADLMLARTATGQLSEGVIPDVRPMLNAIAKETDVRTDYNYEPIVRGEISADKKFYVAKDANADFHAADTRHLGEEIGIGTKMTDNPGVANAASARALADSIGHVWEVEAKDLSPFNLHDAMPPEALPAFKSALDGIINEKTIEQAPPVELMRALWSAIDNGDFDETRIAKLQDDLKTLGYNAFQNDGRTVGPINDHGGHNDITVFDDAILKPVKSWEGNPELRIEPNQQDVQAQMARTADPKAKIEVDPQAVDEFQRKTADFDGNALGKADDFSYADQQLADYQEHLQMLDKQGQLDASGKAELEALANIDKESEMQRVLFKAMETCARG